MQHPVLQFVKEHSYAHFFEHELQGRKLYHYPPFYRLIRITCRHKEKHIAEEAANILAQGLKKDFGAFLNGPAQPVVDRVRNQYLWEILLKLPKDGALIKHCKTTIRQQAMIIQTNKLYRAVGIIPDIDPV